MVRKLGEEDRSSVIDYLSDEPAINLFILGDIELHGFEEDFQELWGSFTEGGELNGVLLHYKQNYIPYTKDVDFDISSFVDIIESDNEKRIISGKADIVARFEGIFSHQKIKKTYFCELRNGEKLEKDMSNVKIAVEEDAAGVVGLLQGIEEFRLTNDTITSANPVESMRQRISSNGSRVYFMKSDEGEIMTVAQTTAENSFSAMVVGVATSDKYRRQGHMSQCLSKLCEDVLAEGRTLCLFYDNPEAGSVYHRLGFESIGMWTMLIGQK